MAALAAGSDVSSRVAAFRTSARAAADEATQLQVARPAVVSGGIVMNTVRQFPQKDGLDDYLDGRSGESRLWEQKVDDGLARRMRVMNPYERSTYTKYYDDKGDWQLSVIENDYRAVEKLQDDWNTQYRRARATVDFLQREYDALTADTGLSAAQQSDMAGMLASAKERMGQFGSPPPELLPRPVEGDANSPNPSYRVFDGITGKIIEIGPAVRGGRRPIAVADPATGGGSASPPVASPPPRPASRANSLVGRWLSDDGENEVVVTADGRVRITGIRGASKGAQVAASWRAEPGGDFSVRMGGRWCPVEWIGTDTWQFRVGRAVYRLTRQ